MKLIGKLLHIQEALHRARDHNVRLHEGRKCAVVEKNGTRYKVVCKECKDGTVREGT